MCTYWKSIAFLRANKTPISMREINELKWCTNKTTNTILWLFKPSMRNWYFYSGNFFKIYFQITPAFNSELKSSQFDAIIIWMQLVTFLPVHITYESLNSDLLGSAITQLVIRFSLFPSSSSSSSSFWFVSSFSFDCILCNCNCLMRIKFASIDCNAEMCKCYPQFECGNMRRV